MDLIQSNLYVSDCESATNYKLLQKHNINVIISLGCDIISTISEINPSLNYQIVKCVSYPNLKDSPEILIIKILNLLNQTIHDAIINNMNVLVHCIYGQSRSITAILSYLISIYNSLTLEYSIEKVSTIRNNVCINPGFLCQLFLLFNHGMNNSYSKYLMQNDDNINDYVCYMYTLDNHEFKKFISNTIDNNVDTFYNQYNQDNNNNDNNNNNGDINLLRCNYCQNNIGLKDNSVIKLIDFKMFLLKYIDNFWKGYNHVEIINRLKSNTIYTLENISQDNKKIVINGINNTNMIISGDEILCKKCNSCVGNFHESKLLLLNNYIICDLYVLHV